MSWSFNFIVFTRLHFLPPSGSLVDNKGKIMIPGIYDSVAPLTDEEKNLYDNIEFDLDEYCQDSGVKKLLHGTKARSSFQLILSNRYIMLFITGCPFFFSFQCFQEQILMHRWRYPSLSLHGIEGAFSEAGAKTVIPRKVIGKFSIRLVPDMDPKVVEKQVGLNRNSICMQHWWL